MLDHRSEVSAGRKLSAPTRERPCRVRRMKKCAAGNREGAGAGRRNFLLHERTGQSHDRNDHEEASDEHGEAKRGVVPGRVAR